MFPNHNTVLHTVLSNYQSGYYLFISTLTAYTYILQKNTKVHEKDSRKWHAWSCYIFKNHVHDMKYSYFLPAES